jgi:galactokinase
MDNVLENFTDLQAFVETTREWKHIFDPAVPVTVTRAPGRLDVMGGIADYSGSLVLQRPTAEATFVALQSAEQDRIEITSLRQERPGEPRVFAISLSSLAPGGEPIPYERARELFPRDAEPHWAAYVAGAFLVLMRERGVRFSTGARILIASSVPEGKGVASSAALEVASMQALKTTFGIRLEPREMALLCQKVENLVAGAPCGVMDQMTAVLGTTDSLLALLCQPAEVQSPVRLPAGIAFWGLDSGERHTVGGSSYESVRTGAFMGYRMIAGDNDRWQGYLANVSPSEFERDCHAHLPEEMSGEEFLQRYSETSDTVTRVVPSRIYKVRQPTAHPVYEHHRARVFRELLLGASSEERWTSLGELMYQSHASYSACGLGSRGTDSIVELVREEGPSEGLYGARITGGGSGGTVAILGREDAAPAVARVRERYRNATGYQPWVFSGSSDGVASFGSVSLNL